MRVRAVWVMAAVAIIAIGCAKGKGANDPPPFAAPSEAYSLRPDGSVPWVDEQITLTDLMGPPPTHRAPQPGSRPCRADQLRGHLDSWSKPNPAAAEGPSPPPVRTPTKFIGEVLVTNVSNTECTLQGETDVRLYSGEREVPIEYGDSVNAEARARVIAVPPGGQATLRLDWSAPFCAKGYGPPYRLRITLPNNGGVLFAPVEPEETPPCSGNDIHPEITGFLYASAFDQELVYDPDRLVPSALMVLTATMSGPASVRPGERVVYYVTLANPTDKPVPLEPCPGYTVELFSQGDATHQALNTNTLYRLNCRPVHEIPARGQLRFEMVVVVPSFLTAGRSMSVAWSVLTKQQLPRGLSAGIRFAIIG
jgi:Protein of unknown function (DUF4232)